ncbi:MAG: amidohydrolase [Selenomonas sp.]|uniref:amidohydrolase family protein n=1 Tax=Selenomonas sp. TaxID=2053611 RepID=UPI002600389A|nr:amidohydrolase family protein [Selenomonas sp.]MCI6100694.1 amidohydrolase [Selenomonas sp.]MCI6231158.1 amidohydrolase [Selenomonas sp.]
MRIIDAHLHFGKEPYFDDIARAAQHENTEAHLRKEYARLGIEGGVVMGNRPMAETDVMYPGMLAYCVGVSRETMPAGGWDEALPLLEQHLKRKDCVGIKLYPGYNQYWIYDDEFAPMYRIAAQYGKLVAVHTGLTASEDAYLKYSHPSVMDEAATKFRDVQFVMCHFGEPWYTDAAAVLEKNPNVVADLSGILEGKIADFPAFYRKQKYYIEQLKGWISYLDSYDRFMFGTDWPLANLTDYITFTKDIIPEKHWDAVFYENAVRIYQLNV